MTKQIQYFKRTKKEKERKLPHVHHAILSLSFIFTASFLLKRFLFDQCTQDSLVQLWLLVHFPFFLYMPMNTAVYR